ncbi:adenosylmethionine--8-amino-7-oxononanoate transaminase [Pseudoalteromonas sp. MMG024]|uniref:adenosylmethionine--8-amino-7-oxononanoate transaminase n=1 Tax=Pseudoalteromonas sp. MMG024 TaxID=2909980 RepID=UPI001EFF9287|nr:adenosylmethionine--8-amino-7-oxononanoate transaminase [Pseudoalteromonas sp. MMG024]MCF6457955.1 adenosylmethionine--8-amino-7-oxononanoate transaminase [Pseudoalteromonas sp. MMG024]
MNTKETIDLDFDKNHLWHPYTSMINPLPVYPVTHADGVHIHLETGEKLIDGMASWWSVLHGYNNVELNNAIKQQVDKMSHVMFGGLTHQPAVDLGKKLLDITPHSLTRIFLADSGSVAVEVAIKMAMQYWRSKGNTRKNKLMALSKGYHGDTFAAMSVCDPVNSMHSLYKGFLPEHYFVPAPKSKFDEAFDRSERDVLAQYFDKHHTDIAAFILEPIVQNAGGMNFYHSDYLKAVRELCDEYDILLICDEIATGFGRTGKMFAVEHANVEPDIMCIGKAMTGGYMTLSATLTTDKVAIGISEGDAGVMMHGPTFMANPLACAVANKSIELLLKTDWQSNITRIEHCFKTHLQTLENVDSVANVRILGAIGVVEMTQAVDVAKVQKQLIEHGVWLRPFGKLIYMMPPYIMQDASIIKMCNAIKSIL